MKIALLVPGFSTSTTDWCIPALRGHVDRLADSGYEVHVYALRWPHRRASYAIGSARVHAFGGGRRLGFRVVGLWRRVTRAIAEEHRRGAFVVIHAFWADEPGWVAVWTGGRLGVPVVVSLAGGELIAMKDIDYGLLRLPGRRQAVAWSLRRADAVTVGSRYLLGLARPVLPAGRRDRLVLAPLGVDTSRFAPAIGERGGNSGNSRERPVVLNVGSLFPVKGQMGVLRAFARVPDAELWIAGDGDGREELEDLARRKAPDGSVRFLGRVPDDELSDLYCRASLYSMPSSQEGFGLVYTEAMWHGLPCIGSNADAAREIIDDGETGLLIPYGDVEATANALSSLLADPARRARMGELAFSRVRERFLFPNFRRVFLEALELPSAD